MTSTNRSNSAKRSASGNLSNSSDDELDDQVKDLAAPLSSSNSVSSDAEANASFDSNGNPCSPGGSSTSSGPVYVRPPGFKHHGKEIIKSHNKKKKKLPGTYLSSRKEIDGVRKREPTPPKHRHMKRDPLPMRLRAFPQSFWQQPNNPVGISPANCHKVLPPLSMRDEMDMLRPVTPPDDNRLPDSTTQVCKDKSRTGRIASDNRIIVTSNADSLLTKLFDTVEEKSNPATNRKMENEASTPKVPESSSSTISKKGRSRSIFSQNKSMLHSCDPYMVDKIADTLFPHLTLDKAGVKTYHTSSNGGQTSLQLITLREGDKSVTLPSLCVEQNYSQMLSDLVPHL